MGMDNDNVGKTYVLVHRLVSLKLAVGCADMANIFITVDPLAA